MLTSTPIMISAGTLEAILDAMPTPVFVKDQEHRLLIVNEALCQLRGYTREEMLGATDGFLPKEQREVFWRKDDEVFATGQPNENEEVLTDGTGALHVIITHKRLIRLPTPDGVRSFIIGTISDVTRFREAEAQARYLGENGGLLGRRDDQNVQANASESDAAEAWGKRRASTTLRRVGSL